MDNGWQDRIVGARMSVDQEFADRVQSSTLSRPQWGLVMTAVEFEIEHPGDPEEASLIADTSKLEHVVPEMQNVDEEMAAMPGGGGGRNSGDGRSGGGSGVVGSIKSALGLGGDGADESTEELEQEAKRLANAYANELQAHLEREGRWEDVRQAAADEA